MEGSTEENSQPLKSDNVTRHNGGFSLFLTLLGFISNRKIIKG
uniref:Uncharacterized protein n=2 Tax=Vibrionaceae TaxID=641 RepID=A0A0H3ZTW8_VIBSP|nr:hypothetical protein [Enterovibrio norvegicus]AKN39808.1 hypothetical protein [Vibrio splendidus]